MTSDGVPNITMYTDLHNVYLKILNQPHGYFARYCSRFCCYVDISNNNLLLITYLLAIVPIHNVPVC